MSFSFSLNSSETTEYWSVYRRDITSYFSDSLQTCSSVLGSSINFFIPESVNPREFASQVCIKRNWDN